ncbi:alanine racemase [Anaerolinea thermophila]|uniref:alanine racemase n=1 Tax=Anaerolinea thermophila TaxID=167964 RepID=UPI0026ED121E|nr:alanine racemase [Anaerolinea thermophila]
MDHTDHTTWLEIDLNVIRKNIHLLQQIVGVPIMAVVKANAYGHGLIETSKAAVQAGVQWLGVARIDEALELHRAGIQAHSIVLGYTPPERAGDAAQAGIRLAVYDSHVAQAYADQARAVGKPLYVHAKFDTGMGRLGASPEGGVEWMRWLKTLDGLQVEGVFTHLAEADDPQKTTTDWQLNRFDALLSGLESVGLRPKWVHAANSAGALYFPRARYNLVRTGIAVYGLNPSNRAPLPEGFRPALTWKTRLTSVKIFPPNHGISYNYRYYTRSEERIGVCAVGYADGFRRRLGNVVLIRGKKVPVVGSVCMDQCMVNLDEIPEAEMGDEVVLIGQQGENEITAEERAREWETISYEVVCGLANRLPRIYID